MSPSSPIDVLIMDNRDAEIESGSLSETTLTKSFPNDIMKVKNCKKKKRNIIIQKKFNYFTQCV